MPIILASDNFNRANENPLVNPPWIQTPPLLPLQLLSNAVSPNNTQSAAEMISLYDGGIVWPDDQFSEAVIAAGAFGSGNLAVLVRANPIVGGCSGYMGFVDFSQLPNSGLGPGNSNRIALQDTSGLHRVDGPPGGLPFFAGDILRIQAIGNRISLLQNGVEVLFIIDNTYTSGKPGLGIFRAGAASPSTIAWDSWSGGAAVNPCIVTGALQTLTSGKIAQGKVIFQLTNVGTGNPIGISGTSVIPALNYTVMTAQDGTFSVPLWGNDSITPSNTLYNVTFRDFQGNEIGPVQYSIVGASANLNTLAASSTVTPPVITPIVPVLYNATGVLQASPHIVQDTVTLAGGTATVTLTGASIFSSASSYSVATSNQSNQNAIKVTQTSGSSITFTSAGATDVVRFIAAGN